MEPTPSRGRAASMGALLSALTVGAVLFVAHTSAGGFSSAPTTSRAGAVDFVALTGADDNDYPSEIDDTYHKGCPGFEDSSVFTSTSCDDTDDGSAVWAVLAGLGPGFSALLGISRDSCSFLKNYCSAFASEI